MLDGDSIKSWLITRSPCRWMQFIADWRKSGVEGDRDARPSFAERVGDWLPDAVDVIDSAAVAWVLIQVDERTCPFSWTCIGRLGTLDQLPELPDHPFCPCSPAPARSGDRCE